MDESGIVKSYTSIDEEYNVLNHGVGIRNVSFYNVLMVHGNDALEFLNRLSTNSLINLKELEWEKTLFTNSEGGIIDRVFIVKFEDYFLLIGMDTEKYKLKKWIERYKINEDLIIDDVNLKYNNFEILGPQAESYLTMICGDKTNDISKNNVLRIQVDNYFIHCLKYEDKNRVVKYLLISDSNYLSEILNCFINRMSVFDLKFVGEDAYNIFRVERGIPVIPNELNDRFDPIEANLISEVSLTKGSFIGEEEMAQINESSSNRSELTGFIFKSDVNSLSDTITVKDNNNEEVGVVTSIVKSRILNNYVGLGYINKNINESSSLIGSNNSHKYDLITSKLPLVK